MTLGWQFHKGYRIQYNIDEMSISLSHDLKPELELVNLTQITKPLN
jgi:hypothetical protein